MGKDEYEKLELKYFSKNNFEFEVNGSVSLHDNTKNLFLISFIY